MEFFYGLLIFVVVIYGLYWLITFFASLALALALRKHPEKVTGWAMRLVPKL
jgi:hypothetical protein